jgi:polyphosphate kinase
MDLETKHTVFFCRFGITLRRDAGYILSGRFHTPIGPTMTPMDPSMDRIDERDPSVGNRKKDETQSPELRPSESSAAEPTLSQAKKMKRKRYERELRPLHAELVAMQEWVKASGAKICIVFEGRDTAGKGGTIKAITERVSPRVFRVVALPAPTDRERSQMYIQRYLSHFPSAGEVTIFDRSWYNRAGVERVMGFCSPDDSKRFLELTPEVERAMVHEGILLIKYWLEVGPDEQTRRLQSRIDDPRKIWKLSDMDLRSYERWDDYSRARDEMFAATDTSWAPWWVVDSSDKRRARLNVIAHLLNKVPYEPLETRNIDLPERGMPNDSRESAVAQLHHVPTLY